MVERILVPLDGSAFSEMALAPATTLAERGGGAVRLVAVHETIPGGDVADVVARDWAADYLEAVAGDLPFDAVGTAVRDGMVDREIASEAEDWGATMIVMATHGRGPWSRAWLGSVADRTMRSTSVPVLLVGPPGDTRAPAALEELSRVVVPLDGSELAEGALGPARALGRTLGLPLVLVRVPSPRPLPASPYLPDTIVEDREALETARAVAAGYLGDMTRRLREEGVPVTDEVVVESHPARAIVEAAEDGLICMATHGRGGLGRTILGSVTDKVVRGATGPVLVVPREAAS